MIDDTDEVEGTGIASITTKRSFYLQLVPGGQYGFIIYEVGQSSRIKFSSSLPQRISLLLGHPRSLLEVDIVSSYKNYKSCCGSL